MKMMMMLRRSSTPANPIVKSNPLTNKKSFRVRAPGMREGQLLELAFGEDDHTDRGNKDQNAYDLEGEIVGRKEGESDLANVVYHRCGQYWKRCLTSRKSIQHQDELYCERN